MWRKAERNNRHNRFREGAEWKAARRLTKSIRRLPRYVTRRRKTGVAGRKRAAYAWISEERKQALQSSPRSFRSWVSREMCAVKLKWRAAQVSDWFFLRRVKPDLYPIFLANHTESKYWPGSLLFNSLSYDLRSFDRFLIFRKELIKIWKITENIYDS